MKGNLRMSVRVGWMIIGLLMMLLSIGSMFIVQTSYTHAQETASEQGKPEEIDGEAALASPSGSEVSSFPGAISGALLTSILKGTEFFNNIQQVLLDGVSMTMNGNTVVLNNLRIASDSTTLDDFLRLSFALDAASLRLIPTKVEVVINLGLYDPIEYIFIKDVTTAIELTKPDGTKLAANRLHALTASASDEFTIYLESGTILTMRLDRPSDEIDFQIDNPDGSARERILFRERSSWLIYNRAILESGIYTIRFVPRNDANISLEFGVWNNNRTTTTIVTAGSKLNASFGDWGRDYTKYRIELQRGDIISVSDPSDDDVYINLYDGNGNGLLRTGGELLQRVYTTGTYYIVLQNDDAIDGATSYSGTVSVSVDPNRDKYPTFTDVPTQQAQVGQPFVLQLSATNDPTQYTVSGLPPGLTYTPTTAATAGQSRAVSLAAAGTISGKPEVSGIFPIRVIAENAFGVDRRDFLLTIGGGSGTNLLYIPILVKE